MHSHIYIAEEQAHLLQHDTHVTSCVPPKMPAYTGAHFIHFLHPQHQESHKYAVRQVCTTWEEEGRYKELH